MRSGSLHLAHGWRLSRGSTASDALVLDFIRPAARAVPLSMARRLGPCRISLVAEADMAAFSSRWTEREDKLDVSVAIGGVEEHDVAMELLLCLGQALWERLSDVEFRDYWRLLEEELRAGIEGEIDEQALKEKRFLLQRRARSNRDPALARYGRASFAGTTAEYVHALWHDVTIRTGPEHLPPPTLRRRLDLLARWFPPSRGYRLFPGSQASR